MKKKRLVSGLLACCMAVFPMLHTAAAASAVNLHDSALMSDEEKMIKEYCDIAVNLVNNERVFERGLPEVATFPLLNEVTCIRAEELNQEFGHYRPDGSLCFSILKQEGIKYSGVAENIAAGRTDPVSTVDQWMNSKGHRDNIINPAYTHLGIGYYHAPDTTYYWSMFLISSMKGKEAAGVDSQYIPERWLGDPDGSHETNAADAKMVLKYAASRAAGIEINVPTGFLEAADVDQNGKVDAFDASAILEYSAAKGAGDNNIQISDFIWQ